MNLIFVLVLLAPLQDPITAAQERIFALIDRVDPLDTSKLAFVKVFTGEANKHHPDGPRAVVTYGFLLNREGDTFTIRFPDMDVRPYKRNGKADSDLERIDYEPADFADYVRKWIDGTDDGDRQGIEEILEFAGAALPYVMGKMGAGRSDLGKVPQEVSVFIRPK